jgi:hypothetical protein
MPTWATFAQARPELAELGRQLLDEQNGYAYLATVTAGGAPRVHPVVPVLVDGRLVVAITAGSPKTADLRREPRYMLHATVGQQDTEFAVRGHALEVVDGDLRRQCVERQDLNQVTIADDQVVFALRVDRVDVAAWPEGKPVRHRWTATGQGVLGGSSERNR